MEIKESICEEIRNVEVRLCFSSGTVTGIKDGSHLCLNRDTSADAPTDRDLKPTCFLKCIFF